MKNFNLKFVFILISTLLISNFSEFEAKDTHDDLKIDMNGSYKNDTIRISMTISNYGEQNYYFQLTYWLMSGFGAAPNNVSLRNEPLFYNEIIFHKDDNDGLFDGAYSFPTFNKLPQLVSLKQGEVFKINFQFVMTYS